MKNQSKKQLFQSITVAELIKKSLLHMRLELFSGVEGITNRIKNPYIQKPGMTFAGYPEFIKIDQVQILGKTEISYLKTISERKRKEIVENYCTQKIPCIITSKDINLIDVLIRECDKKQIPLIRSSLSTGATIEVISRVLKSAMAPMTIVHGVMLEIFGLGLLITGEPGIGKSEAALDLITRGHRLIADDAIRIKKLESDILIGYSPDLINNLMEIRGLGVINIKHLFGMGAIRYNKKVELVICLEKWKEGFEYDRLGFEHTPYNIMGCEVPQRKIPVAPGRNLAVLIETAVRNHLVQIHYGSTFETLERRMNRRIWEHFMEDQEEKEA